MRGARGAPARLRGGACHGHRQGQADDELKKFYSDVLPPDQRARAGSRSCGSTSCAEQANVQPRARTSEPDSRSSDSQLGQVQLPAVAVGRLPQHPPFHPRARNGAGVPRPRKRRAVAGRATRIAALNVERQDRHLFPGRSEWKLKTRVGRPAVRVRGCSSRSASSVALALVTWLMSGTRPHPRRAPSNQRGRSRRGRGGEPVDPADSTSGSRR